MNRIIKFRAWNGERMIEPISVFMPYDGLINHENGGFTLMQFTGLLDKNGKEIYEGDILKIGNHISEVSYSNSDFSFIIEYKDGDIYGLPFLKGFENFSVIGNIYENPELLIK